ncbi:hypothetical protein ACFPIK_05540 [Algoriphagus aquatilis]|uniref:Type II toxin-antitoxin system HicA family toxin n=1 Tax=Algoriphagus aquatilis TaxID=490186 RepID=A0ABW0BUB5_9BACT
MAVVDGKKALKALLKKGFKETENKSEDHKRVEFWYNGKLTRARTKFSHNNQDLNDSLISLVSKQICLSKQEFIKFVDCSISEEKYIEILRKKELL